MLKITKTMSQMVQLQMTSDPHSSQKGIGFYNLSNLRVPRRYNFMWIVFDTCGKDIRIYHFKLRA